MFTITKIAPNNFSHFDGFKEMNFSNWEINFNNTTNTIILQLRNGAPFPKREVLASEVIIKDGISGTPETFSTTEQIRTRLLALNYNPLQSSGGGGGGAVDSVNGQTGVVVLDADDISETATRKWQSADQDTFNDATSSIQTQLDSKQATLTDTNFGSFTNALTEKTTLVDADLTNLLDSADSNKAKKVNWLNVWNYIKSKADLRFEFPFVAGTNITIDRTVPNAPVISASGGGATTYQYILQFLPQPNFAVLNSWYSWLRSASMIGTNPSQQNGTGTTPATIGTWYADTAVFYLKDCKQLNKMSIHVRDMGSQTMQFYVVVGDFVLGRGNETNGQVVVNDTMVTSGIGSHIKDLSIIPHSDFNPNSVMYVFMRATSATFSVNNMQLLYKFENL